MVRLNGIAVLALATLMTLPGVTLHAQSESELVRGDWHCKIENNEEPVLFQLLEVDKAQMCSCENKVPDGNYTRGVWTLEDIDYNDDDLPVVTLKVNWDSAYSHVFQDDMTVKLTFLSEDKLEVRWMEEPVRIWTRIQPEDSEDE